MTRFKATPDGDGGFDLRILPDEPAPTGHKSLAKTAAAVVVIALIALYGCGGHGSSATTPSGQTPSRTTTASPRS